MGILDSDILIAFLRNKRSAVDFFKRIIKNGDPLKTTILNVGELYTGVYLSSNVAREIRILDLFLENFEILFFNKQHAILFGQISADLKKSGFSIGPIDEMIASIALNNKDVLITNNLKHFQRIKHLEVQNWKS